MWVCLDAVYCVEFAATRMWLGCLISLSLFVGTCWLCCVC